jgi:hypothetical protein
LHPRYAASKPQNNAASSRRTPNYSGAAEEFLPREGTDGGTICRDFREIVPLHSDGIREIGDPPEIGLGDDCGVRAQQ